MKNSPQWHSMTAFGRVQLTEPNIQITLELKTYNSKHIDIVCHFPPELSAVEFKTRQLLAKNFSRGKFDLKAYLVQDGLAMSVHNERALHFSQMIVDLKKRGLTPEYSLKDLQMFGVFTESTGQEELDLLYFNLLEKLIVEVEQERLTEGVRLGIDIYANIELLRQATAHIVLFMEQADALSLELLRTRFCELFGDIVSEQRLMEESAWFILKGSIAEEIVRLNSHLDALQLLMTESGEVGRKLDFLCQELQREANTINSKTTLIAVKQQALIIKECVEKIREQGRNVE
jgi:uncharacterized protein (TIGR00255 family)